MAKTAPKNNMDQSDITEFTGINRLIHSKTLQLAINKRKDGTFQDFIDCWKWIFSYSMRYRWPILLYTLCGIISTTLGLASSVLSKYLIDVITGKQADKLLTLAIFYVGSMVASILFSSLVSRISARINIYVNNDIQAEIFDKIIDSDWLELSRYPNGDLLNRFNSDVGTVADNAVSWVPDVVIAMYQFIATFFVILHYDVIMAIIALSSAPFLALAGKYLVKKNYEYRQKVLKTNSSLMSYETEAFYNVDTIKSFGVADHYSQGLRSWQEKYKQHNLAYNMFTIKTRVGMNILSSVIALIAFGYCLFRLWTGAITYGTMTLFLTQRSQLSSSFSNLISILPGMLNSAVSAQRIREIVNLKKEEHLEKSHELDAQMEDGFEVRMENVNFSYVQDTRVITDSAFVAEPGQITALVGPSGEGKTTMIRLILGLVHPEEGSVLIKAADGNAVKANADTRHLFSYVPQGNTILSGTVAENLRMVKEDASDAEIIAALKIACAWDFVSKLPQTIHSSVGEKGRGLSEGQAQRIAIARAVLRDSPILLLDEATSALDIETERQVLRNIIQQRPNKTCIVTTHRPSVLNMCQRVYRVVDTRVNQLDEDEAGRLVQDF